MILVSAWLAFNIHYHAMCYQPNWIGVCAVHYGRGGTVRAQTRHGRRK